MEEPTEVTPVDVVVVGAGFTGLAAAAGVADHAGSAKGRTVVIEQGRECGAFWLGGHERLSLHSPYHRLPHDAGLADAYPMFKSKAQVRDYLAAYAASHGLDGSILFGETVLRIEPRGDGDGGWPLRVRTDRAEYAARRVVVATGLNRAPHVPAFEGLELHPDVRHSWHVASCDAYAGKRVLLVGSGNSAAELAVGCHEAATTPCMYTHMCNPHAHGMCILRVYTQVACHEAGAACVELLVDGPRHVVRRSTMGAVFRLFPWLGLSVESMVRVRMCACARA